MSSRYRIPETTKVQISLGDWLLVKKHLTAGEERRMYTGMSMAGPDKVSVDLAAVQPMKMAAYLLDWSLTDVSNKPIVIADQPREVIVAALDGLPPEDFDEIWEAITAHENAMKALREQEKKLHSTENTSSLTLPSPDTLVGSTTG